MEPIEIQIEVHKFRERCRREGINLTVQRQMIFEAILECGGHPTPEEVHACVAKRHPAISLATVYKNVKVFLEGGVFREAAHQHNALRIETNPEPHQHLVCSKCRRMFDIDPRHFEAPRVRGKLPAGFEVRRVYVEMVGLCGSCARKEASKKADLK